MDVDEAVPPKSAGENYPEQDEEWQNLQERKFAIQPLTEQELADAERVAAYPRYD